MGIDLLTVVVIEDRFFQLSLKVACWSKLLIQLNDGILFAELLHLTGELVTFFRQDVLMRLFNEIALLGIDFHLLLKRM